MDGYVDLYKAQMEALYNYEIPVIRQLQLGIDEHKLGWVMQLVSRLGSPQYAFTLFFPLLLAVHSSVGVRYLWVAIISDWLNMVLKWLLHGERPYWFIHESANFTKASKTYLAQTPVTCEAGPGSPSGHVMANVILFVVICDAVDAYFIRSRYSSSQQAAISPMSVVANRMVWNVLLVWQALVAVSRIYNLNHFPHQCALAWMIGLVVVKVFYHSNHPWMRSRSRLKLCLFALFLLAAGYGIYSYLVNNGFNPDWSIAKAKKWCKYRKWVKVDTTPLFTLMLCSGAATGLAFAVPSKRFRSELHSVPEGESLPLAERIVRAAIGIGLGVAAGVGHKMVPEGNLNLFYAFEFSIIAIYTYLAVVFVPLVSNLLFGRTFEAVPEDEPRGPRTSRKKKRK